MEKSVSYDVFYITKLPCPLQTVIISFVNAS